jgi:DNA-binding beta-propeller fold protein YncE
VVRADSQAKVYLIRENRRFSAEDVYRGCVFGGKRSYRLAPMHTSRLGGPDIVLAGHVVAYELGFSVPDMGVPESGESEDVVYVTDLLTGRTLHRVPTGTPSHPNPSEIGIGSPTTIVVKPDGSVAWIVATAEATVYEVHAVDKAGRRLLASGPDIAPNSLALAGSTLYWTQGGEPISAPLN